MLINFIHGLLEGPFEEEEEPATESGAVFHPLAAVPAALARANCDLLELALDEYEIDEPMRQGYREACARDGVHAVISTMGEPRGGGF